MARSTKVYAAVIVCWITLSVCLPASSFAQADRHDIDRIIEHIDELYRSETSYAEVDMEIVTPRWRRTLTMKMWTVGMDKTFIRILSPRKEMGMGTLRIDNEMWNYLPKTNKVMKIPPSMMMGSWMGSDFTNDDLVSEISYVDDYTYGFVTVESPEEGLLYIKAVPNEGVPVVWGYQILAIRESDHIPAWEKYYDEKGRLMRTMAFSDIRQYGSRMLPSTMEVIPANKEGHKTTVRYSHAEFDQPIQDEVFSLRNLRSPR